MLLVERTIPLFFFNSLLTAVQFKVDISLNRTPLCCTLIQYETMLILKDANNSYGDELIKKYKTSYGM